MSINNTIVAFIVIVFSGCFAQNKKSEFVFDFLEGHYEVIGRWPDSMETYTGRVSLIKQGDCLQVLRYINKQKVEGIGKIVTATPDDVIVLRVRFMQNDRDYEGTYVIDSDLDNYGRLTGYLYLKEGETKQPGLEALFIDRYLLKKESMDDQQFQGEQ